MKVIDNMKNRMNKEFQHCVESELIEVMNFQMQMIQFVSLVDLIQRIWMKIIHNLKNMMNKQFQNSVESRWIEVMNMKMQMIQFVSIVNLIQMKWMKIIYTMENMTNQEFQHCMESKLVDVMNIEMHSLYFVSIVNVIQMKLMTVIHNRRKGLNNEFQQCMESKVIEVMTFEMQRIQFVSIVNLIQMKSMKVRNNSDSRIGWEWITHKSSPAHEMTFERCKQNHESDRQNCSCDAISPPPGVIHRDLKLNNIFWDWDWNVRIAEFGDSTSPDNPDIQFLTDPDEEPSWPSLDASYLAAECSDDRYFPESDVLLFGLILNEFLVGQSVF
jgi:serine/threonine protein kinase